LGGRGEQRDELFKTWRRITLEGRGHSSRRRVAWWCWWSGFASPSRSRRSGGGLASFTYYCKCRYESVVVVEESPLFSSGTMDVLLLLLLWCWGRNWWWWVFGGGRSDATRGGDAVAWVYENVGGRECYVDQAGGGWREGPTRK